ncbi:WhiB family transcriptional regulator [Streptomyces griseoruber]|uniref:WhiB family transcriptional regulator n=1 Tax=Streptomyces griseoruber TaxID=1943 RepID=UPI003798D5B7
MNLASSRNNTPRRSAPQRSGRCPVREQCLDRAMNADQALGVWGGTTEAERRALRRRTGARRGS